MNSEASSGGSRHSRPKSLQSLYPQIRSFALSGAGLWSLIAFLSLGAACFVALALSVIWALDIIRGAGSLYAQFSFLINGANPLLLLPWLSKAIPEFEQARGNSVFDPSAWHLLLFMCCLLFAAHICRFDKPRGESLLLYPAARPVAEHLLQSLGYFVDIRMPMDEMVRRRRISSAQTPCSLRRGAILAAFSKASDPTVCKGALPSSWCMSAPMR